MSAPILKYLDARELIQDGDILSFRPHPSEYVKRLTCLVTNTPYYHTGMAVWLSPEVGIKRLFVIEAHKGGRRLIPMSLYEEDIIDVICCPIDFSKVSAEVLEKVGKVPYGYIDFVIIGLKEMIGLPSTDHSGEVCSEFVAKTCVAGGVKISDTDISPGKLDAELIKLGAQRRVLIRS